MKFQKTKIAGLFIVESERLGDERGYFSRYFCEKEVLEQTGSAWHPTQINHSYSKEKGTIRGLHFQHAPAGEIKFVRCIKGKIFDVAVDLRAGSPTFLQHMAIELSENSGTAFLIPKGCAHGFQTLSDDCEIFYLNSTAYSKEHEAGIRHDDSALGIKWPLPATVMSERDKSFALIEQNFVGVDDES